MVGGIRGRQGLRGQGGGQWSCDKDVCMCVTLQRMVWCSSDINMSERQPMSAHTHVHT